MDHHELKEISQITSSAGDAEQFVLLEEAHCFLQHRWPYHSGRGSRLHSHGLEGAAIGFWEHAIDEPFVYRPDMNVED